MANANTQAQANTQTNVNPNPGAANPNAQFQGQVPPQFQQGQIPPQLAQFFGIPTGGAAPTAPAGAPAVQGADPNLALLASNPQLMAMFQSMMAQQNAAQNDDDDDDDKSKDDDDFDFGEFFGGAAKVATGVVIGGAALWGLGELIDWIKS